MRVTQYFEPPRHKVVSGAAPAPPTGLVAPDCRHYRGDRPCIHNRVCRDCPHYAPFAERICVIKLGALGDVIRTLCILPELRAEYPAAQVTWVSLPNGCRMLNGHPQIDRLLPFDPLTALTLGQEFFDLVINLDKEAQPCALAAALRAPRKLGMTLSAFGTPIPANAQAHDYFALGLSDDLKFRQNKLGYPALVYAALGWAYSGQRYELPLEADTSRRIGTLLGARGWRAAAPTLGVNVGAGNVFANKMWPAQRSAEVIRLALAAQSDLQVLLLGGPEEAPTMDAVVEALPEAVAARRVIAAGTRHTEKDFVALVDACDVVFTGDTMAMHVALARGRGVVAVFGPTCPQEIDLFGQGEKLIAQVPCGPCYKRVCDHQDACVHEVPVGQAATAIGRVLYRRRKAMAATFPLPQVARKLAG